MGIRIKLLLTWFVLLLTPLAILGGVGYAYIDSELRKEALAYQTDIGRSVASAVNRFFERLQFVSAGVADHSAVVALISRGDRQEADLRAAAFRVLGELLEVTPEIREFRVVRGSDLSETLLVRSRAGAGLLSFDPGRLVLSGASNFGQGTPVYVVDGPDNKRYLLTATAIGGVDSPAYLLTLAGMEELEALMFPQPSRDAQVFVADHQGNLITGNRELAFASLESAETVIPTDASNSRILQDYQLLGKSHLLSLQRLDHGLWLAALTDNELVFARKQPYIVVFFMALSLTLLLSGVIFNLIVNGIAIKPINKLIEATRQIARGDLNPTVEVRSRDELGELASAFRQMGQQLLHTSRRIRQLAYFDPLTQLPNRTTLRETLSRLLALSEREKTKTAVLFIDLDDFKKVNDRLGHEAGDELLIQISERLKNRLRQADILIEQAGITSVDHLISRRGGDEFNAILTSIKAPHDAAVVAERIIQDLNQPFLVNKSEIHVGASVGVALFPDDGADADTLLHNADLAMYEAKAKGKNNYHIFTSAINEQVHQRLALENSLQVAMVQSQFCLYYQPKVSLIDMNPVGFEALIRWQHPERGIILPSKFIPVAEDSNLIRDIGNWVLGESMQQIQLWNKDLPKNLRIAINLSARQLAQNDLVGQLRIMMEHFSISPARLEIEMTETSVLQDEEMAIQHLHELRRLGVEVSLDDFGTGYSSLSFLRKLPIDTVKIDRSFTANIIRNTEARAIVASLLKLCRELKVKTIAEGIETTQQLQFLMEHGCDQGQGFLFSKPLPASQVLAFLEKPDYLALA